MANTAVSQADPQSASEADEAKLIGERVRAIRAERGMTIQELALKAGLSIGGISQIERGNSNPSVGTLNKLKVALGVNLWAFLEPPTPAPAKPIAFVRKRGYRPKFAAGPGGLTKELLSPRDNNELRFMLLTLPPSASTSEVLTGPGDKGGYVMSGSLELTVGELTETIKEGDSFQFKSHLAHHLVNTGESEAGLVWIIRIQESHL